MALSVLMAATLFCFILGVREPPGTRRRWLFYGLYASAALATLTKGLIGFLIPGAVMFLWLLLFNQWKRLRPLHLPDGLVLFAAIAGPWHLLAAQRHPQWAEFYFINEHFRRYTDSGHGRTEPWWYFGPVLLLGLFPWLGFVSGAIREAVAGGWRRRHENVDAWYFVVWASFIFFFFSVSHSKLIPYVLPVFPPLAVLIGARLARCGAENGEVRVRLGLRVFSFVCGVIAVVVLVLVLKPGAMRDAAQAAELRPAGIALASVLLVGGVAAPWIARIRGATAGLVTLLATSVGFFAIVVVAAPHFQRADTKSLALLFRERAQPDDRVYHFWAFFHDFVYYSGRPVGLVSYTDELEVQFLDPAERAARFIDDAELKRQWVGAKRIWVVLRKRDLDQFRAHVITSYQLIGEGRGHYLLSNQP
jgi:4-amino-4-deoxy-L-arabinose transferase-like glycosyltransferase